ncbi:gliding motility-associated C-terminal domain-containing protein [Mucilaginibacter panaciglaebae]|uniref:T9SS type B sorting domain-containing protein n=1 Tax=Mucilaginibacter panaciglaebae TaxID=502331 RepID=UPI0031EBC5F3
MKAQSNQTVENGEQTKLITLPGGGCSYKWTVTDNAQIGFPLSNGTGNVQPFTAVNNTNKPITAHISITPLSEGFAYVANSLSNNVTVINTSTHDVVTNIPVDSQPFGVAVSPDGRRVYVVNSKNETGHAKPGVVSVIDAASNTIVGNYTVGKNAKAIVVNPDGKRAYVANESSNTVSVVDLTDNTSIPDITVTGPLGIAISVDGSRLYVGSTTAQLYVIDAATNQVLKKIPVQSTYPTAVMVSPDGSKVYVTNNTANYICVIDVATGGAQTVTVGTAPFALAITPAGDKLYVSNAISRDVTVVNTASNTVIKNLIIPSSSEGISVSPNGKQVFVVGQNPNELEVIDTSTDQLGPPIPTNQGAAISIGNFVTAGIGCSTVPITYSITVNPSPNINAPGSIAALSTHYGIASTGQVVNVGGNNLKGPIIATAPAGFEISKDDIIFKDTLMVGTEGDVAQTEVFVRLKATTPVDTYHGNIQLSSPGAEPVNVPVEGAVLTTQLNITADNKTKFFGDPLPTFTVTYTGFVNGDGPSLLTTPPTVTTTAVVSSPVGKYPINVAGAIAKNYAIAYVPGILEIVTGAISTPNAFTPNGDGINDTWDIKNLSLYAGCTVEVLNRYGQQVYYTNGYPSPWNGTFKGQQVPIGTYYYIIKLKSGTKPLTGSINIIR